MTLIAIIAIMALFLLFSVGEVSIFWVKNSGMGNTPRISCWRRIPADWSPLSVNDMDLEFLGSAHGVPTNEKKACAFKTHYDMLGSLEIIAITVR
jgi:hypothetical protein